jgi:hypothetical protein
MIARFLANYLSLLQIRSVPTKTLRWYRRWAEQSIQGNLYTHLATRNSAEVSSLLNAIGRQADLADGSGDLRLYGIVL